MRDEPTTDVSRFSRRRSRDSWGTVWATSQRGLGRAGARCFSPGPSAATDGGRSGPQGEREGSRSLRRQHREVLSAQPAAGSGPCAQEVRKAAPRGLPFSLVTFSWASKRKTPARRDAGRTHQGREPVFAKKPTIESAPKPTGACHLTTAEQTHQQRESVPATNQPRLPGASARQQSTSAAGHDEPLGTAGNARAAISCRSCRPGWWS